jgi:hypothetical protein
MLNYDRDIMKEPVVTHIELALDPTFQALSDDFRDINGR